MTTFETLDLEPLYLYILTLLPVRKLEIYEQWRQAAGSFEAIYLATDQQLKSFGLGYELVLKLRQLKAEHNIEKLDGLLRSTAVRTLPYYNPRYFNLLREVYDAPPVLFYRGDLSEPDEVCVAIVGSRHMTAYGQSVLPRIAEPLINSGVTIVSGLALGIDGAAHAESIKLKKRTIAVLGCGVDDASIYPRAHYYLAQQILDNNGLLISEQPPRMPALRHHFVARNRIIAGLSLGVVIVECKSKSGALITADYAADFNRALYAVPGPIYSALSEGPHKLINDGARLIASGIDILDDLGLSLEHSKTSGNMPSNPFNEIETALLKCMQSSPATIDKLTELTNFNATQILGTLTELELRGAVSNLGAEGFLAK
jgi:DNA processing protein